MGIKESNEIEIEVFRQIDPENLPDFIEKNGQKIRDIMDEHGEFTPTDIIEALTRGYRGL